MNHEIRDAGLAIGGAILTVAGVSGGNGDLALAGGVAFGVVFGIRVVSGVLSAIKRRNDHRWSLED